MVLVMDSVWNNECSSRPQKLHLEGTLGSSESSNDFNPRFEPEINTGESFSSDRSSKNSEFDIFAPYKSFRAPQSSVSSSSAASSDDLFEVIPISGIKPHTIVHSTGVLDIQSQTSSNNQVSSDSSAKSDDTEIGSSSEPAPASTASNIVYEPRLHTLSPTQSPPVQNMDRSGEFEPYRIPSSVFARNKSLSPADWSIASNDSLFSIQLGDNSFSRDHVITWGDDLPRSSERLKSSELIQFGPQPSEAAALPQVTDDDRNDVEKTFKAKQQHVQFVQENGVGQIMEMAAKNTARPVNSSRNSDGSGTSGHSFSFPVLTGMDRGNPVKIDSEKSRHQLQNEKQSVQTTPLSPTSKPPSKSCCSSCGSSCCCCSCCSCWSCCSWQFCCSWLSCCSCRFCCSCCGCYYSLFSCHRQHCCCRCC